MSTAIETPINYALTDLMGVTEVADALGVGYPWTGADLANVMELVLMGYDEMRAQIHTIDEAARRERLNAYAWTAYEDGVVRAVQALHRQGARIAETMREWNMTYEEWLWVFSFQPHPTPDRWERSQPTNTLIEFEQAVYDGANPKQLCGRFKLSNTTYQSLIERLGLGGRVRSQRWTPTEKAMFKLWVLEGCGTAELVSRAHRELGRTISRARASEIRAEINKVRAADAADRKESAAA